jgi:hypothetical protein
MAINSCKLNTIQCNQALCVAIEKNDFQAVQTFIQAGVDPSCFGSRALHVAFRVKSDKLVSYFLNFPKVRKKLRNVPLFFPSQSISIYKHLWAEEIKKKIRIAEISKNFKRFFPESIISEIMKFCP